MSLRGDLDAVIAFSKTNARRCGAVRSTIRNCDACWTKPVERQVLPISAACMMLSGIHMCVKNLVLPSGLSALLLSTSWPGRMDAGVGSSCVKPGATAVTKRQALCVSLKANIVKGL